MSAAAAHDAYLTGLSSGLGAVISVFVTFPLQNLVTRFQLHSLLENSASSRPPPLPRHSQSQAHPSNNRVSKLSDWEIFKKILQEEGISKLYTGFTLTMIATSLQEGIFIYYHELFRSKYRAAYASSPGNTVNMSLGIIAGMITASCVNPISLLSTRLSAEQKKRQMRMNSNPIDALMISCSSENAHRSSAQQKGCEEKAEALKQAAVLMAPILIEQIPLEFVACSVVTGRKNPVLLQHEDPFPVEAKSVVALWRDLWISIALDFKDFLTVFRATLNEGILTFWSGILLAYILTINPAITKTIADFLIVRVGEQITKKANLTYCQLFIVSAVPKTIATLVTYPLTLVKSRLYVSIQNSNDASCGRNPIAGNHANTLPRRSSPIADKINPLVKPRNMWTEFLDVLNNDGFWGLYRGLLSKIIQNCLMTVINNFCFKPIYSMLKASYPGPQSTEVSLPQEPPTLKPDSDPS